MKEALRLYTLRYASGRLYKVNTMQAPELPKPLYFPSKAVAKAERDRLNAIGAAEKLVVSLGPDHKRFHSGTTA